MKFDFLSKFLTFTSIFFIIKFDFGNLKSLKLPSNLSFF